MAENATEPDANGPCPTCDFIGPDQLPMTSAVRDLHRAFHDVWRTAVVALGPLAAMMQEAADRERQATKDAYVLVSESYAAHLRGER